MSLLAEVGYFFNQLYVVYVHLHGKNVRAKAKIQSSLHSILKTNKKYCHHLILT